MGKLKVLPAQVANMIAAGEVVQRPASVVKELMENAVDAGATQVDVIVTDAGRTNIQVVDNGCGMSPSDAVLCFERHATSKISAAEDLDGILTYGFRGEALASIAAVSDVVLRTRRSTDETATEVRLSPSGKVQTASKAAAVGSFFSVSNLFYNTPARRKFLKSDKVELKHIIEEFTRVAIIRPEIAFTLNSNGRDLFVLKKAKSLKFRILDLLGSAATSEFVDISAQTSVVRVHGFVGRPDAAKRTPGKQFFFINGRYFRSPYLHKAVMRAYEDLVPEGVTPAYFICLETAAESVDVNIHPTKAEVKFEDDSMIFQILYACARESLGRNSFGASIDFDTSGAVDLPELGKNFADYAGISAPVIGTDPDYDPFRSVPAGNSAPSFPEYGPAETDAGNGQAYRGAYASLVDRNAGGYGRLFDIEESGRRLLVVRNRYILTPVESGVMVIDARRARERILYERYLGQLNGRFHTTQVPLFPVDIEMPAEHKLVLEEHADTLELLGFDLEDAGAGTLKVNGVPEGSSCDSEDIQATLEGLVGIFSDGTGSLPGIMEQTLAEKMAARDADHWTANMSEPEAVHIVDTLFAVQTPELTPRGKRTLGVIKYEELDKFF